MSKEYQITLTEEQMRVTQLALEEYFRLRLGQEQEFCHDMCSINDGTFSDFDLTLQRKAHLSEIMKAFFKIAFEPHGYLREKTEDMMVAECLWDAIRFARGVSRWDQPFQIGSEPSPKIVEVSNETVKDKS